MAVITLSRQTGSSGNEIAQLVCQALGYRYFDKQMLAKAASEDTGSEVDFLKFTEEDFVKGSRLMSRLLNGPGSRPAAEIRAWEENAQGQRTQIVTQLDESRAIKLVQNAIRTVAEQGQVVILGRGAQIILQDRPNALHVRVVAPWEDRVQRVKLQYAFRGEDARTRAQDLIFQQDDASADYVRRFYDVRIDDPQLYHLVLNTGRLRPEAAAQIICQAARALPA